MRIHRPAPPLVAAAIAATVALGACSPLANLPLPSLGTGPGNGASPAAPSGSAPSASVDTGSPGPTSAAQQALAVLDAVKAWGADETTSFKVTYTGRLRYPTGIATVKGSLLVDGGDAQQTIRFKFSEVPALVVDYRRVGGSDWSRTDGGKWRSVKSIPAADMVDAFRGLREGTRLTWLGPVEGADDRFTVVTEGFYIHPVLIPSAVVTDEKVRSGKLTLIVREDGTPVSATWEMRGNVRVQGTQVQGVAFDLELEYSRLGDDFDIEKP